MTPTKPGQKNYGGTPETPPAKEQPEDRRSAAACSQEPIDAGLASPPSWYEAQGNPLMMDPLEQAPFRPDRKCFECGAPFNFNHHSECWTGRLESFIANVKGEARANREIVAEELYTAYCAAVGGKAFNGDPLPEWEVFAADETKQKQADAWRAAADRAMQLLTGGE